MFSRLELLIGKENVEYLKNKKILIVGLGGVGGNCILSLVRSGISNVVLVDYDIVDESNLNRQVIAYQSTIGKKKIEVMKELILDINPNCNVICHDLFVTEENIPTILDERYDYVIDACDSVPAKKGLIRYCFDNDIPIISSMGTGNRKDPSKLEIIDLRKTQGDPLARIFRKWFRDEKIKGKLMVLNSCEVPKKTQGVIASCSFVPNSAGNLIAHYVFEELLEQNKK